MSVLNFPRIYLGGHFFWNPPTANNNDMFPLYDAVKMQMNWPFLKAFGITPENAASTLMPWTIAPLAVDKIPPYVMQVPGNAKQIQAPVIPGEWNLFGDNACGTVNYNQTRSVITGGELPGGGYVGQDPLIDQVFQLVGNPFGSNAQTPARFVDVSPWQNAFTALYFDKLILGDTQCGLTLNREHRMLDRFLNFNWANLGGLSYVTTTWQTCFPKENLEWALGDSALLENLQAQMQQQNAKGLMLRFSTYLTVYDKNGILNNYPPIDTHTSTPQAQAQVEKMYRDGLANVGDIFFNPAYSRTVGTVGLWFEGEFPTAPAGQRLVPASPVPIGKATPDPDNPVQLGVISAQVHDTTLSLDLANTFPFYPVDKTAPIPVAAKYQAGTYQVGVRQDGAFKELARFGFEQYQQSAFDQRSGILDLPLGSDAQNTLKATGPLELRLIGDTPVTAAVQQRWTAEVVESASFIDVGDTKTLQIMVQQDGAPAPAGTVLWVAEYANAYMLCTTDYYLTFSNAADFTLFYDHPKNRTLNNANLPQFRGAATLARHVTEGTGRQLMATRLAVASDAEEPVSYAQFLSTPAAVPLSPCLKFKDPIPLQGTLQNADESPVNYSVTRIQTDAQGIALLTVTAQAPGFPTLRFFVQEDETPPAVPFSFPLSQAFTDFLAPLRVLPQEPHLVQAFIEAWNPICHLTQARVIIWETFIYPRILQPFYYLYPIMSKYMPLNSLERIEGAVDQLIVLISKPYQEESTLAMPITRDMPQSRRAVLELWARALVKKNYPPRPLGPGDVPQA
ncbi:hypothetical protein ACW9H6_08005 [Pseudomonas sp. SDO528_S397]